MVRSRNKASAPVEEQNGSELLVPAIPWRVVHRADLPDFLRDNKYIIESHRPEIPSFKECAKSLFRMHTETLNIWTHLLGCIGCVLMAMHFWMLPVDLVQKLTFSVFFAGAIFCLGCSAVYHTLLCHSEAICHFLSKMDYVGIIILIVSSFPPWLQYGFWCHPVWRDIYLVSVTSLGLLCVVLILNGKIGGHEYIKLRAALFMGLGLTGVIPGLHYLYVNKATIGALLHFRWLVIMAGLYLSGGVIYALRIPERLKPGTFDVWCQSHQIMHMCVIGGVLSCYVGICGLADYRASIETSLCEAV